MNPYTEDRVRQTFRVSPASILILGLLAAGCSRGTREADGGSWQATRDTVGDTIVVATISGSVWGDTADLVPEVKIGMLEGPEEYTFGQIVSVARAPDGTIYAVDRHVPALRSYDTDGHFLRTLGGPGGGPGEYEQPDGGLAVLSDGRVLLRDPANARIQVFGPDGEPLEAWRIRGGFNTSARLVVDPRDRAYTPILLDAEADIRDWKMGLAQILPDGSPGDTLVPPDTGFEGGRLEAREEVEGGVNASMTGVPFSPSEHSVLSSRGYFVHGISTDYAITLLKTEGPLRVTRAYEPVPVTSGERSEEEARVTRDMRGTQSNWRWNGPPMPDHKPPFSDIHAGEDGTVWLRIPQPGVRRDDPDYDPTDPNSVRDEWSEPILFDVFDEEGRYLGAVRAPEGFSGYPTPVFTRDWVLGTMRDELDVQSLVLFRVTLPGGRTTAQTGATSG